LIAKNSQRFFFLSGQEVDLMNALPAESHTSGSPHGADSPGAMQVNEEHRAKYMPD